MPNLDALCGSARPVLLRQAKGITRNADDAEDLVQETLLRAAQRFETFDGRSTFDSWCYRIMVNIHLDNLRSARAKPHVIDTLHDETQGFAPEAVSLTKIDLERAVVDLPKHWREVLPVLLKQEREVDFCRRLGMAKTTVSSRITHMKKHLRISLSAG